MKKGRPFATLVNIATASDGLRSCFSSMSTLATHTALPREMRPRLLILLPHQGAIRWPTAAHRPGSLARDPDPVLRARFPRHPSPKLYAGFADFRSGGMNVEGFHLNGGVARAADFAPKDILTDLSGTAELFATEESALAHLNADHADALRLYAAHFDSPQSDARWHATGIDPEGLDLSAGRRTSRICFPRRIVAPKDLREISANSAKDARCSAAGCKIVTPC